MSRAARWEVVRTDAGWHARFRSSNGNVIVSSETYRGRRAAENAIYLICGLRIAPNGSIATMVRGKPTEIRPVDERRRSDG